MGLTFAELTESPIGPISFYAGDSGLEGVAFSGLGALKAAQGIDESQPSLEGMTAVSTLLAELNAYFFGLQRSFSVAINWELFSGFRARVLRLTAEIPYGAVRTYGEIARELGSPGGARAVGSALRSNPMPIVIPCHRVIGADGSLQGYLGGREVKAFLLGLEGHPIDGTRVKHP